MIVTIKNLKQLKRGDEMDNEQISEIANELFNDDESLNNDDNSLKR